MIICFWRALLRYQGVVYKIGMKGRISVKLMREEEDLLILDIGRGLCKLVVLRVLEGDS